MNFKALVSGGMLALLASSAMAQSLDPVRIEMFRSILEGNECVLTEAQAANILPRFDFERDETRAIVGALVAAGEVRLDGNTLNLVDGSCGSDDPVADLLGQRDVQQFIAVMAEYGCAMTEAEGEEVFTARGISKDQVGAVLGPMMQNGMASFDAGAGMLSVNSAYCSPVVVAEAPVEAPVAQNATAEIMAAFNREGCSVSPIRANDVFTSGGLSLDQALAEIGVFIARGDITFGPQGEFIASDAICGGAPVQAPVTIATVEATEMDRSGLFADDNVRALVDLMSQNSCRVNLEVADNYTIESGFSHRDVDYYGQKMVLEGYATMEFDGPVLLLPAPYCIPIISSAVAGSVAVNEGSPEGVFLSVMSDAGCALAEPQAKDLFEAAGLRMDQAYLIADEMVANGEASFSADGTILTVSPARCGAVSASVATLPVTVAETSPTLGETTLATPTVDPSDPRAGLLAMLAANNCEVTQSNAAGLIAAAGLEFGPSMQMLTQMMGDGSATSPDGGQTLQVNAPLCVVTAAEPQTPREIFINLIKQNNCSVTAAEFSAMLPVDGLDATTAFAMISELEAEGDITLPPTRDTVTLSAENCR